MNGWTWFVGLAVMAAAPGHELPRELWLRDKGPPVETACGYIQGEFNVWGQWNNQPKVFDLVDDVVVRRRTDKLAFTSEAMYRECERNDGMAVEIRAIRAKRADDEWLVVLEIKVLP